jgi:hypothetical protein
VGFTDAGGIDRAVNQGDVEALMAIIDSQCLDGEFEAVVDLRHRCRAALARGVQLWPVAAYADYRLALDADGALALTGLGELSERFMLGPITEVLASTHTFGQLGSFLPTTPDAATFAAECVVRGADLVGDSLADRLPTISDVPRRLEPWEPSYSLAEYRPDRVRSDPPSDGGRWSSVVLRPGDRVADAVAVDALRDLVGHWLSSSDGRADIASVSGTAEDAVGSFGLRKAQFQEIAGAEAMAHMAWAAGSGGARARRRGAAAGRDRAWWAVRALSGLDEDDVSPDEIGEALGELRWLLWSDGSPDTGWHLRLAVEDPAEGLAWAIAAVDAE